MKHCRLFVSAGDPATWRPAMMAGAAATCECSSGPALGLSGDPQLGGLMRGESVVLAREALLPGSPGHALLTLDEADTLVGLPLRCGQDRPAGLAILCGSRRVSEAELACARQQGQMLAAMLSALPSGWATAASEGSALGAELTLRRREHELAVLHRLAAASVELDSPEVLVEHVLDSILELTTLEAGMLLYHGQGQAQPLVTQRGLKPGLVAATCGYERASGMAALYACLAGEEPNPASGTAESHLLAAFSRELGSWMVLPLHRDDRPNGLLLLAATDYHTLSDNLSRLLSTIIHQLLMSMERHQAFLALEDLVHQRTAELRESHRQLEATVEELKRMDQFKTDFLSNVSHELRTPLSGIIGYGEFLAEGVYGQLTEDQGQILDCLVTNSYQLMELINNLLDLSRLDAGKLHLYKEPIELKVLFQQAIGKIVPQATQKRLAITMPEQGLPTVEVDPGRIVQVLVNLLANAIKFTPEGGSIRIEAQAADATVTIAVRDDGIGIAPEQLPRLFQRFSQGDSSTTRRFGGTGLGLAISRELMELHGQHIWVESCLGQGSAFYITLPIWAPTPEPMLGRP